MSEVLVEEYRGGILENVHRGRICVVDGRGEILCRTGDADQITFFRSSSKPLQVLPVISRGLDKMYGLTDPEVTIMAGSHSGEKMHIEVLESILDKTGFQEEELIMNPVYPFVEDHRNELIKKGMPPRKLYHNCAGKHLALMMLARETGGDYRSYWKLDNPAEQEVINCISCLSEQPVQNIGVGIDGCGVPVFAVPLHGIARSFMKLACPDRITDPMLGTAAVRMGQLINGNPYMMRGHGFPCGELNLDKNIVAKGGAKGIYSFGMRKEKLGIALKLEDGTEESWPLVIAEILKQLGYRNEETYDRLRKLNSGQILNDNRTLVGENRVVFTLQ